MYRYRKFPFGLQANQLLVHLWLLLFPLVQLQLVIDETVCESNGAARVCVQLGTDTEREVTASVQTSDLSARSESCMVVLPV